MVDFTRTKRALAEYDQHSPMRRRLRATAHTEEQFRFVVYVEHVAADFVRQAYMVDAGEDAEWSEVSIASVDDIREVIWLHAPNRNT